MRTRARKHDVHRVRCRERGAALLLALGILTAVLLLGIGFSYTTVMDRQGAGASADLLRARLLAESGVERAMAFLQRGLATEVDPGTRFFVPEADSAWSGRRYLASINGDDTSGIQEALAVELNGLAFTPAATLHDSVGWIPIRSVRKVGMEQKDVLVGRLAYLVIDESGKIDPGAVVSAGGEDVDETPDSGAAHTRTGASVTEISLADAGIANADSFRPRTVAGGTPGQMPDFGAWHSLSHILRATGAGQSELNDMAKVLRPYSRDDEVFWRDANANGRCDSGETQARMDLTATLRLDRLYELFLGPDKLSGDDDCTWLKELDASAWVAGWKQDAALSTVQVRQRIAAQTAVNILDYADPDSNPTLAYVDGSGQIHAGNVEGQYNVRGVERGWGVSRLAMRVEVKTALHEVSGSLNINPGNSSNNQFEMQTPGGPITRETLHDQKVSYSYEGIATEIKVKPKSTGRTLTIDGEAVSLDAGTRYTISADSMSVRLYNSETKKGKTWGNSMGNWWLEILEAVNVRISPDPRSGIRLRPAFQAQAFFPFSSSHDNQAGFTIGRGRVTADEAVVPEIKILGAKATYEGLYTVPITLSVAAAGRTYQPWGDWDAPVGSTLNDGDNPRYTTLGEVSEDETISLKAVSWLKKDSGVDGKTNSDWTERLNIDSSSGDANVLVLRNGDSLPALFSRQEGLQAFVADYVAEGKVTLASNQAIFLFELETLDLDSSEADFQDLAVLLTLNRPDSFASEPAPPQFAIDYVLEAEVGDASQTATGTVTLTPGTAAEVDGGRLAYVADYQPGDWMRVEAGGDSYRIVRAEISRVRLLVDEVAVSQCPLDGAQALCRWSQELPATDDENYYAFLQAYDPMLTQRAEADSDFSTFWEALPRGGSLAVGDAADPATVGQISAGYTSSPYSGIAVANEAFSRIGQIGRVHSYRPMQSLRLWSAATGDESGHDAGLLDLFKTGSRTRKSGKVMINSQQEGVLTALFKGAATVEASRAAQTVLARRAGGTTFANIGQLFGGVAGISGSDATADAAEEAAVEKLAELVTVRQNYFTVIIVAQALKDVEGIRYDSDGDGERDTVAKLNVLDVKRDAEGKVVKYIDPIRAEQKIMAVVYRDALTNEFSIERFEYLQ